MELNYNQMFVKQMRIVENEENSYLKFVNKLIRFHVFVKGSVLIYLSVYFALN